jgi:hypothetical protein
MDIDAVEIKTGEGVTLRNGETATFTSTVTYVDAGPVIERQENGPAYVERDGVLEVYPDWQRPFVD